MIAEIQMGVNAQSRYNDCSRYQEKFGSLAGGSKPTVSVVYLWRLK